MLIGYRKKKAHDITVVFDGWKTGEGKEHQSVIGGVRVIYSRIGENADFVIKRIISSVKREWIVITSDRDIAQHAWASGSIPVTTAAFLHAFKREEISVLDQEVSEDEDEYTEHLRKGNSRKPSKKDKAVMRALHKL